MILDGERIKGLVSQAGTEVLVCAPFIKLAPFKIVLGAVPSGVPVTVATRWRAAEVALGVSDLEIFDEIAVRENAELRLIDNLHAKLFVADELCLAGSANVTAAALGWSGKPNVELLVDAETSDLHIRELIARIRGAALATQEMRARVEEDARNLSNKSIAELLSVADEQLLAAIEPWLPRCAAPDKLFNVYQNPDTTRVPDSTRLDALADLSALLPPVRLSERDFASYIARTIRQLPGFQQIIREIPARIDDAKGEYLISDIRKEWGSSDCSKQWAILQDWLRVFLHEDIEVAPQSYVVRLKPRPGGEQPP